MMPVAMPQLIIGLRNLAGEQINAPVAVWVGCILATLPPDMREEVITRVGQYIGQAAAQGEPSRIVMP